MTIAELREYCKDFVLLYVEDEIEINEQLTLSFVRLFKKVYSALDGLEALEIFNNNNIDMIISDIRMPKMDGVELASKIRSINSEIPIIFMTAHNDEKYLLASIDIGIDKYILKPIIGDVVYSTIFQVVKAMSDKKLMQYKLKLASVVYNNITEGVLVTDSTNSIVATNPAFSLITGYFEDEVLNKKPNILKSSMQTAEFYKDMWFKIKKYGKFSGEIYNRKKNGEIYLEWINIVAIFDNDRNIINYVATFSDITKRKEYERKLEYQANHDTLTGLANRNLVISLLTDIVMSSHQRFAILMVDLDGFKGVNDVYGHQAGDTVLSSVASRLRSVVREDDTVARIGGDEFIIVLSHLKDTEEAGIVAKRVIDAINKYFLLSDTVKIHIGVSIGIALYPTDDTTVDGLIRKADDAMYQIKLTGKNDYKFFEDKS